LISVVTLSAEAAESSAVLLLGVESNNNLSNYQLVFYQCRH
jgi:hypothetical protein